MNHSSTMQRLIRYFCTPARPHNQSGFGLAPVLAGLAITLLVFQGFSAALAHYRATPRINETAAHMEKVSQAAAKYVQDNYGQLTNALTLNGPATTITTQALRDAGYFSQTLSDTNPYGQSYSVRVRYVTQGSGANQRNVLEPMVLTEGGHSIPDNEALRIAGKVDAGGSIRSSDPSLAIGNNGGWQVALSDFGGSPGEGHLAVGMFYSDAGLIADYLYRNALPGRPEVNQMNTDIDMAGNSVNNAETVQAAQAHLTRIVSEGTACAPNGAIARNTAGIPMVCENGIWTQSATLNWIPSQGQRLQMTAANGQSISIQNDNGRFRWVNSDWTTELASVDQLGNLSAAGRLRTGEFLQIDGIAVEGEACSPDGLIGRDAAGLILSCKSEVWKSSNQTSAGDQILKLTGWITGHGGFIGIHEPSCPDGWSFLNSNRWNNTGFNEYSQPGTVHGPSPWTVTCFSSTPKLILQLTGWRAHNGGWGGDFDPVCPNGWSFLHSNKFNNIGGMNGYYEIGTHRGLNEWTLTCTM